MKLAEGKPGRRHGGALRIPNAAKKLPEKDYAEYSRERGGKADGPQGQAAGAHRDVGQQRVQRRGEERQIVRTAIPAAFDQFVAGAERPGSFVAEIKRKKRRRVGVQVPKPHQNTRQERGTWTPTRRRFFLLISATKEPGRSAP